MRCKKVMKNLLFQGELKINKMRTIPNQSTALHTLTHHNLQFNFFFFLNGPCKGRAREVIYYVWGLPSHEGKDTYYRDIINFLKARVGAIGNCPVDLAKWNLIILGINFAHFFTHFFCILVAQYKFYSKRIRTIPNQSTIARIDPP